MFLYKKGYYTTSISANKQRLTQTERKKAGLKGMTKMFDLSKINMNLALQHYVFFFKKRKYFCIDYFNDDYK